MSSNGPDLDTTRLIARVLTLHYQEGLLQAEIATSLGLSSAKVNRLIKQGRELGMIEFTIHSQFQRLFDLEGKLKRRWDLKNCVVVEAVMGSPGTTLVEVGKAAGSILLETVKKGETIAISGGKALNALAENLDSAASLKVDVVPMTGGVQGQHYTDVNYIASRIADSLGGTATLLHAPLHADTADERELLMSVRSVRDVMDKAKQASVALFGIGSVTGETSTYYKAHPVSVAGRKKLYKNGVRAEFLGYLIDGNGALFENEFNSRLVGLPPADACKIPTRIGIASGLEKAEPICAALNGGYINTLVVDDQTAQEVLEHQLELA